MANPWFRLYSEFAFDAKVQLMPVAMQRHLVMLMCLRCGNVSETFQERELLFHLRISGEELQAAKTLFIDNGFIDDEWRLLNWDKRQYISDVSTDRVRRYRKQHETFPKRCTKQASGVTVTPPDTEQIQNRTDTKTIARFTSSDIERVYEAYPRKVGKGAATRAIKSALNRLDCTDPVTYLVGVTREFAKSPAGNRGEFTPHPATFYNQSRYLDDPEEWEKVR